MRSSWVVHRDIGFSTTSSEVCNSTCEELGEAGDENRLPDALDNFGKLSPSLHVLQIVMIF